MDVDDTLVLILERIDSIASLIRAASTCRRWRRVIADAGFLRRWRSVHGPPIAGDYYNGDYRDGEDGRVSLSRYDPWFVPSSSIDAGHFSLDFLVGMSIFPHRSRWDRTQSWMVMDSRGSLLLMQCNHDTNTAFPDLVVCEPLAQSYKIIPRPPDLDSANYYCRFAGFPYLVDGDEDAAGGRIGMSNFRVLCVLLSHDDSVAHTTVFTARGDTDAMWSEKCMDKIASRLYSTERICMGHMLGSDYFYLPRDGTLITHDGSNGMFCLSKLPQAIKDCYDAPIWTNNFAIVNGGDGEPRIVIIMDHTMEMFARVDGEWKFENKVLLSEVACGLPGYQPCFFNRHLTIVNKGVGFVVISPQRKQQWPFSVDLKTLEVAPVAKGIRGMDMGYQYEFPWPPVLQVCVDR